MTLAELEITLILIIRQLLQAVNYLHNRKIVHRDIRLDTVEVFQSEFGPVNDVRIQLKSMQKAKQLSVKGQRLYEELDGL